MLARRAGALALLVVAACTPTATPGTTPARSAAAAVPTSPPPPALWRTVTAPRGAPSGSQWVGIDTFDAKTIVGMVQTPATGANAPVLVVLHGDGGLRPKHIEWAASLTRSGFITLTPCWLGYSDPADSEPIGCSADAPQRDTAANAAKDFSALVAAARTLPRANPRAAGLVAHSTGAAVAIMSGSLGTTVEAIVAMSAPYGQGAVKTRWGTSVPDQVDGLRPPLLIVHGTNDQQGAGTRIDVARAYEKLARDKGKTVESIYPEGAPHEFPFQPQFWTDDLRGQVVAFLKKYLRG